MHAILVNFMSQEFDLTLKEGTFPQFYIKLVIPQPSKYFPQVLHMRAAINTVHQQIIHVHFDKW